MTDRDKIREQLSAWLDGELSDAEVRRLEKAVELDAELATELEQLRATRELIRRLPRQQAPEDFVDRVLARAERMHLVSGNENQVEQPGPLRWVRIVATAAILLISVGTGIVITWSFFFAPPFSGDVASKSAPTVNQPLFKDARSEAERLGKGAHDIGGVVPDGWEGYGLDYNRCKNGFDLEAELGYYYKSEIRSIEIYTDNLEVAQKDVVKVLEHNRIQTVGRALASNMERANNTKDGDIDRLSNSYQVRPLNRAQVQIVVLVDEEQLEKLDKDLKKVISEQPVSQESFADRAKVRKAKHKTEGCDDAIAKPADETRDSTVGKSGNGEGAERGKKTSSEPGHILKRAAAEKDKKERKNEVAGENKTELPKADQAEPAEEVTKTDRSAAPAKAPVVKAGDADADKGEKKLDDEKCAEEDEKSSALPEPKTATKEDREEPAKNNDSSILSDGRDKKSRPPAGTTAPSTQKGGAAGKKDAPTSRKASVTQAKQSGSTTAATATQAGQQVSPGIQRRSRRLRPVLITLNERAITTTMGQIVTDVQKPPASQPSTAPECDQEAPVAAEITTKPAETNEPAETANTHPE